MYRAVTSSIEQAEEFETELGSKLAGENRWVVMAKLIPWSEFEMEYAQKFDPEMGAPAKTFRLALGILIIKEKLGTSDRETIEQIIELSA